MNVYFFLVLRGELGTATMNRTGCVEDFRPATLRPSLCHPPINSVTQLQCGVENLWLGPRLWFGDRSTLGDFWLEAVPNERLLFKDSESGNPRYLPQFEFRTVKQRSAEYFNADKLAQLNQYLAGNPFCWRLASEGSLCELGLADLPEEIELVEIHERRYRHAGEMFRVDSDVKVLGVHERTEALIGNALRAKPGSSTAYVDTLAAHKRRWWVERLDLREKLRAGITEFLRLMTSGLSDKGKLEVVLSWLGEGSIPTSLLDEINTLRDIYNQSEDYDLRQEFSDLPDHLREVVRDLVISEECETSLD